MAEKRVKLFVVEGLSEETAFAVLFKRLFSSDAVMFDVVHGDVTTCLGGKPARDAVREQVVRHVDRQVYNWGDIAEIVHLVDTDGAFVPEDLVVEGSEGGGLAYFEDRIETPDPSGIARRNRVKAAALDKLSSIDRITNRGRSVPYRVYYLSRNMEHALHGVVGSLTDRQKEELAHRFQRRYKDDLGGFVAFMRDEIGTGGDYRETWRHLHDGANSLRRGSNLHLALPGD